MKNKVLAKPERIAEVLAAADELCMTCEVILSMYGSPSEGFLRETKALRAALDAAGAIWGGTPMNDRRTIDASDNPAVLNAMRTRNNGRYNGNGREWGTPPELFKTLDDEFHFTLDACASPENAKVARYFSEAQNGLEQDWGRDRVFMNPPYGKEIYAWTKKARESAAAGALVVGLLPASTDLRWWHDDVQGHAEYRFIRGRVRFITGGRLNASGFFASVVVIWRPCLEKEESAE